MSLVEYRIDGVYDKEQHAIETLQAFCPEEGYYVAFSGGKDSVCIKKLCDLAGVKYDAHYNVTSVDPPELVRFIKEKYPDVSREIPHYPDGKPINMWNLIVKKKFPPTRLYRYCCAELKERGGYGRMTVTGVRWAESRNRKNSQGIVTLYEGVEGETPSAFAIARKGGLMLNNDNDEAREFLESCYRQKKTVINPIIDWEDEDVWEFIHKYNIPYCELYDKGYTRLGCIGCPMQYGVADELNRYPKYKRAYILAFEKMLKARAESGMKTKQKTGEEVMEWWISDRTRAKADTAIEGQMEMEL